ncbi:MAG TPA: lysylphosphatidylglycerol synthase transmembrane domain-containing protein [Ilumatobacter sp.]|nr:lysylphosphatidylglycerol synthase transmembrane domain-containing protein [Ilumatobacter sp.]
MTDPTPPVPVDTGERPSAAREPGRQRRPFRFTIKLLIVAFVVYYFVVPLIPDFEQALHEIQRVQPVLLVAGLGLQMMALWTYVPLTRSAIGEAAEQVSSTRLFRIQMSTRALSSIVPGGSAASSALGYRLLTMSGVPGADAGFALAIAGVGSAVVLNLILWATLLISIPIRGVNAFYGTAALAGVIVMTIAGVLVFGLMEGQGRAERAVRWIARKFRLDDDRAARALHRVAERLEQLLSDRQLLARVVIWSTLGWLFNAASLWVFLRAFNITMDVDALLIAFGIANVLAAVPITPGGLGYVDAGYVSMLAGFGASARRAALGVASYRFAQLFFPTILGGLLYLSLRVGPWSIVRRDGLKPLHELAEEESLKRESTFDFDLQFPTRDDTGQLIRRPSRDE